MIKSLIRKNFPQIFGWAKKYYYILYQAAAGKSLNEIIFTRIYKKNSWGNRYTYSGDGSVQENTKSVSAALPGLIKTLNAQTFLDIPCGDFFWMKDLDLPVKEYIGADIVKELIRANNKKYTSETRKFIVLDLTADELPAADIIFCRDCLPHLPVKSIIAAFKQIKKSRSKYLLTSTYIDTKVNKDITLGLFYPVNLELPPFNLPKPVKIINDACVTGKVNLPDKSIGLWRITDIPDYQ